MLTLVLPEEERAVVNHLTDRGELHFPQLSEAVRETAAKQMVQDRKTAKETGQPKPGQAEYLDLLRVLARLQEEDKDPAEWLQRIAPYTFQKGPEAVQVNEVPIF